MVDLELRIAEYPEDVLAEMACLLGMGIDEYAEDEDYNAEEEKRLEYAKEHAREIARRVEEEVTDDGVMLAIRLFALFFEEDQWEVV